MKLLTRISSIRRTAPKACRSWSAHSSSMCALSFARCRDAGWTRSPWCCSSRVTGSCASQSTCRSGCRRRSSPAMATSRRACPRPMGEDRNRARRRRRIDRAAVRTRATPVPVTRSTKARISRLTRTGSRAGRPCPAPSTSSSVPPVSSASRSPIAEVRIRSSVPCRTRTGQVRRRHRGSRGVQVAPSQPSRPRTVSTRTRGPTSSPQAMQSSTCLVECASVNMRPKKNRRKRS